MQHAHRAAFGWESQTQQAGGVLAVDDFGGPGVAHGLQDDDGGVRMGHFAYGLGNELERLLLIGALQHGGRQRLRGADPPLGALRVRVQVRVFNGDTSGGCERAEDGGIGGRIPARLPAQVQASVDLLVHEDRDAQERGSGSGQIKVGRVRRRVDEERHARGNRRHERLGDLGDWTVLVELELQGGGPPRVQD